MHIFYRTEHFASTECTFSDNNKHGIINLKQDKDGIQMAADGALIGHRWAHMGPRWGSDEFTLEFRCGSVAVAVAVAVVAAIVAAIVVVVNAVVVVVL